MPVDVIRFGVGHRRTDGSKDTVGISGRLIHNDARGLISELAFSRGGRIQPHSNPNTTYFIVIEGGGWVVVGDERVRVAAGDAVVWPPNVDHAAWTDYGEMRAFTVEFAGADDSAVRGILEGSALAIGPGEPTERGEGSLAPRDVDPDELDRSSGEPL
jgi:quercetin dioxygenase-like cupin family protein